MKVYEHLKQLQDLIAEDPAVLQMEFIIFNPNSDSANDCTDDREGASRPAARIAPPQQARREDARDVDDEQIAGIE